MQKYAKEVVLKNIISQSYNKYNLNTHSSTPLENVFSQLRSLDPNSHKNKHLLSSQEKKLPPSNLPFFLPINGHKELLWMFCHFNYDT